jgi:circadian clock protein KaiB
MQDKPQDHQPGNPMEAEIMATLSNPVETQELEKYVMRLYVADKSPKSLRAIRQIQKLCEAQIPGRYELEIIDIYQHPEELERAQIFAIPTLIKERPLPTQRLIGDMTDQEKVIISLDL